MTDVSLAGPLAAVDWPAYAAALLAGGPRPAGHPVEVFAELVDHAGPLRAGVALLDAAEDLERPEVGAVWDWLDSTLTTWRMRHAARAPRPWTTAHVDAVVAGRLDRGPGPLVLDDAARALNLPHLDLAADAGARHHLGRLTLTVADMDNLHGLADHDNATIVLTPRASLWVWRHELGHVVDPHWPARSTSQREAWADEVAALLTTTTPATVAELHTAMAPLDPGTTRPHLDGLPTDPTDALNTLACIATTALT